MTAFFTETASSRKAVEGFGRIKRIRPPFSKIRTGKPVLYRGDESGQGLTE